MRTKIIKIGNSCGIIIPSGALKTLGVAEKSSVSISLSGDGMTIKKSPTRFGWAEAAKLMRQNNDDELLIPAVFEDEIFENWE